MDEEDVIFLPLDHGYRFGARADVDAHAPTGHPRSEGRQDHGRWPFKFAITHQCQPDIEPVPSPATLCAKAKTMGRIHVAARIENASHRSRNAVIPRLLVDTGSEYTWIGSATLESIGIKREKMDVQFVMANGTRITRSVGFAIIRVDDAFTVDELVFAEKGDLLRLGTRSLEGLALMVDSRKKKLVAAGPLPVA